MGMQLSRQDNPKWAATRAAEQRLRNTVAVKGVRKQQQVSDEVIAFNDSLISLENQQYIRVRTCSKQFFENTA